MQDKENAEHKSSQKGIQTEMYQFWQLQTAYWFLVKIFFQANVCGPTKNLQNKKFIENYYHILLQDNIYTHLVYKARVVDNKI